MDEFIVQIFATRKAVAPLSNILSCWADQYGSIDTSNPNTHLLVIILWQNILKQQYVAQNSLHTTLPNILYCSRIKKCNRQTDRKQTDRETNYRGHSNPPWIAGLSGPIIIIVLSLVLFIPGSIIQIRHFLRQKNN